MSGRSWPGRSILSGARRLCVLAGLVAAFAAPALADAPARTLDRLREEGVLRLGIGVSPPFSYRDANGNPTGYSVEICRLVAEDLRRQLGLARLDIVYVQRTPIDRVQLLNEGRYDLECDASTDTPERRKSAAFALAHFFTETRFVALSEENLTRIDDLRGRSVATTLGTVNIGQIGRLDRDHKLQLSLVTAETIRDAFDLVTQRRASAFVMDAILLRAMVAESGRPEAYVISEEPVSAVMPYGLMMRLGDTGFHDAVNAALRRLYPTPQMAALYDRWFRAAPPGLNFRLDIPMSPELSAHFASFR